MAKAKSEPDVLVLGDHPSAYFAAADWVEARLTDLVMEQRLSLP